MKKLIVFAMLAGVLFLGAHPALAQTACHWVGSYWYCNSPGGTTSCHWVGSYWYCN
jgi:hypothetical protein